jgi:hypothetical protein
MIARLASAAAAETGWPPYVWTSKKTGIFSAIHAGSRPPSARSRW